MKEKKRQPVEASAKDLRKTELQTGGELRNVAHWEKERNVKK